MLINAAIKLYAPVPLLLRTSVGRQLSPAVLLRLGVFLPSPAPHGASAP
jgi:hypothetical protein